jgi:hypothetical protein
VTSSEPLPAGRVAVMSEDGIATVTLDRPAKLNAIGPEMLTDLDRRLAEIDVDSTVPAPVTARSPSAPTSTHGRRSNRSTCGAAGSAMVIACCSVWRT